MAVSDEASAIVEAIVGASGTAISRRSALAAAGVAMGNGALNKANKAQELLSGAITGVRRLTMAPLAPVAEARSGEATCHINNGGNPDTNPWARHYTWGGYPEGTRLFNIHGRDWGVGCVSNWQEWQCNSTGSQWLRYAVALEVVCDYSNELYDHFVFRTFMNCGDKNWRNTARLWDYTAGKGGDIHAIYWNKGYDKGYTSLRTSDLRNDIYCSAGITYNWLDSGWHQHSIEDQSVFVKRQKGVTPNSVGLEIRVDNVYKYGVWHGLGDYQSYVATSNGCAGDISFASDQCNMISRWDLLGKVFSIAPNLNTSRTLMVRDGVASSGGKITTGGAATDAAHLFLGNMGYINCTGDDYLYAICSLIGAGGTLCFNSDHRHYPTKELSASLQLYPYTPGDEASMHWIHEGGTGRQGYRLGTPGTSYIICDGTGKALDVPNGNVFNDLQWYHEGYGGTDYPAATFANKSENFVIKEARLEGKTRMPDKITAYEKAMMPDWQKREASQIGCTPRLYEWKVGALKPRYRMYLIDSDKPIMPTEGAYISANWTDDWFSEKSYAENLGYRPAAHGHVGFPCAHGSDGSENRIRIFRFNLKLENCPYEGSIVYSCAHSGLVWEEEKKHNASIHDWSDWAGDDSHIYGLTARLEGEAAKHYDVDLRAWWNYKGWSDHSYSNGDTPAKVINNTGDCLMAFQVSLVPKPEGATVVREFSTDDTFTATHEMVGKYVMTGMHLSIDGAPRDKWWHLTDRLQGDAFSDARAVDPLEVHFMAVDENGDTVEFYTGHITEKPYGLAEGDYNFTAAEEEFRKKWPGKVWEYSKKFYLGDKDEPDYKKTFKDIDRVEEELYIWLRIQTSQVRFYMDSDTTPVVEKLRIAAGTEYTFPYDEATQKAIEKDPICNLNAQFGTTASTGLLAWFSDPELTDPAPQTVTLEPKIYNIFGRARLTVRFSYADGSEQPVPDGDYRVAPREDAAVYAGAMALPSAAATEPVHRLSAPAERTVGKDEGKKGIARAALRAAASVVLPAIGDDGDGHKALYKGESLRITSPATVYRYMGDHRWRSYRCEGWSDAPSGGRPVAGSMAPEHDTEIYVKWTEVTVDGVVTERA